MSTVTIPPSHLGTSPPPVRWTPPRLAWALLAGGLALSLLEPTVLLRLPIAGALCIATGLLMAIGAKRQFRAAATPVCPASAPAVLVTRGWFSLSRNPMYLGLALVLIGTGLCAGTWPALIAPLVFGLVIRRAFVPHEEERCAETFGDAWSSYSKRVPRWL